MSRLSRLFALAVLAVMTAACCRSAKIDGVITAAPSSEVVVKVLNSGALEVVDTVACDDAGKFSYRLDIEKGQVEFVYLYRADRKLASLLVQAGDRVDLVTDTLGVYTVSGSEESVRLSEVENAYAEILRKMNALSVRAENAADVDEAIAVRQAISDEYVAYYRDRVKYVMANSRSMAVIPVLYQTLGNNFPVFGQTTDAIHFRNVADSLALEYPDSRHVKALRQEAERRLGYLGMENLIRTAPQVGYPEIELPDLSGRKQKLSEVDAKVVMIHFWTATDAQQKMFNLDVLNPLYERYHSKGFEIYQVALDTDKGLWARVVKEQKHPWVSVCDSRGTASPYVATYNIPALPAFFIINDGALVDGSVVDEASLRKLLDKLL